MNLEHRWQLKLVRITFFSRCGLGGWPDDDDIEREYVWRCDTCGAERPEGPRPQEEECPPLADAYEVMES